MYKPGQIITYKGGLKYRCVKNKTNKPDCTMCDISRHDTSLYKLTGVEYCRYYNKCGASVYFKCIDNKCVTF